MTFNNFILLLERTMRNAGGPDVDINHLASRISQPTSELLSTYTSVAAKIAREITLSGAQELWELAQQNSSVRSKLSMLHCRMMTQSAGVSASCQHVKSQLQFLHASISQSLRAVVGEVEKAGDASVNPLLIRWLDASITGALLFIPFVGPALSEAHNNVFSGLKKLIQDMAASRAPVDAVAGAVAATTREVTRNLSQASPAIATASRGLQGVDGFASLIYGALSWAIARNNETVAARNYPCHPVYASALRQSLRRHEACHESLAGFSNYADSLFRNIERHIDLTVQQQLNNSIDDVARYWQTDAPPCLKKPLILMGYFYGKQRTNHRLHGDEATSATPMANVAGATTAAPVRRVGIRRLPPGRRAQLQALRATPHLTALQKVAVDDVKMLTSKTMLLSFTSIGDMTASVEAYCARLRHAAYADIDQALQRSTFPVTFEDRMNVWRLYIGAQLIVSHALNDSRLKSHGKLKRALGRLSPTTEATAIPGHYVNLIRKAGFIVDYIGVFGVTTEHRKRQFAETGKIRWSVSPSNTERALLITFCILVISSLDVGKLLLGLHDWSATRDALARACTTLSQSALKAHRERPATPAQSCHPP